MEVDISHANGVVRPPVWVFAMLFLAYLGAHVAVLLLMYTVSPSIPFVLAEMLAIVGGAAAVIVTLFAWRRSHRA
jgi:hypothetical protein